MKALTIYQPWASLIMIGAKPHEFRGWDYAARFPSIVGTRIIIHASARPIRLDEVDDIMLRIEAEESALVPAIAVPLLRRLQNACKCRGVLELSAGIGTAVIGKPISVTKLFKDVIADSDRLDHSKFGWPLTDLEPWNEPIPCRGLRGFWDWPYTAKVAPRCFSNCRAE